MSETTPYLTSISLNSFLELPTKASKHDEAEVYTLCLQRTVENELEVYVHDKEKFLTSFVFDRSESKVAYEEAFKELLGSIAGIYQASLSSATLTSTSLNDQSLFVLRAFLENADDALNIQTVYLSTKNKILIEENLGEIKLQSLPKQMLRASTAYDLAEDLANPELGLLEAFFLDVKDLGMVRLLDLFKSPLGALLPWELINPDVKAPKFLWHLQALRKEAAPFVDDHKFSNIFLLGLSKKLEKGELDLKLVERPYDDRGFSVELSGDFNVSDKIEKLVHSDVLFESGKLKIEDHKFVVSLDYDLDVRNSRMLDSVFHFKDTKTLYVTKEDVIREKIKSLFSADKIKFKLKSLSFEILSDELKRSVSYEPSFFDSPLEKITELKKILPKDLESSVELQERSLDKLTLLFSNVDGKRIDIRNSEHSQDPNSVSIARLLKILLGLKGGLSAYLGKDPTNMAVKGNKRISEIKLLKSSGFFMYLVSYWIGLEKGEEEFDEAVFWQKAEKVIAELLGFRESLFDDLVSSFFIDFVETAFNDLKDSSNYKVLQVLETEVAAISFKESLLCFLEPLLMNLSSFYKRRGFVVDKFENFEVKPSHTSAKGTTLELFSPCSMDMGFYIKKNTCMLDETKVKIMSENSFKAELKVVENGGDSEGEERVGSKMDWFELDPKYYFEGVEISEEEAKKFRANSVVNHNGQLFFIPEKDIPVVKWLNYFWDKVAYKNKVSSQNEEGSPENKAFFRSFVLDILALRQSGIPVEGGERWQEIAAEYDALDEQDKIELDGFEGKLKGFQEKGVTWLTQLYKIGLGGILADDMGLGKTVQVLAFLNHLQNLDPKRLNMVVVPTSLVHNWKSEAEKFTPDIKIFTYKSGLQQEFAEFEKGLVIVTYGLLSEHQTLFLERRWDTVIFDEAQQLKNIKSIRSVVARKINAQVKICLTGTPMENHYGEFYSLVDLSVPGALGAHADFMKIYGPRKVNAGAVGQNEIEYLKLKSKPLVLRRTKNEVLKELPDKTESVVKIDFDDKQKEIYRNVAMSWNSKVQKLITDQGENKTQIQMFAALMKLRQVCSCPDVVVGSEYTDLSPKLTLIADQVEELLSADKSVLVFTNFVSTLMALKKELVSRGCTTLSITGKDAQKKREATLGEFNEEGEKALLMTLKTGGVGLNLTKANYIIHVEPWWNPAAENQGTDRAHRIGQKQSVHVYRYIMNNSIEEKIQTLKESKQAAFNMLLSDENGDVNEETQSSFAGKSGLTKKDFEFLLS
jgi:superfamily II DNA or RNA helicase